MLGIRTRAALKTRFAQALLAGLAIACAPGVSATRAQTASSVAIPAPLISVPPLVEGLGSARVPLPVELGPADSVPARSFLRIRGLPISVGLSEGHAIAPGAWAVPLARLPDLHVNLPAGPSTRSTVTLQLVSLDGAVIAEAEMTLIIREQPAPAPPPATTATAVPPPAPKVAAPPPPPGPPPLTAEQRQRAERMLGQGDKYLDTGNIEIARQFYQRAAEAGLAVGALRLAATYDPNELSRISVKGVVPSIEEARRWYERARQLGAPEAEERIARLGR